MTVSISKSNRHQPHSVTVPLVLHRVVKGHPQAFEDISEEMLASIARHVAADCVLFNGGNEHINSRRSWLLTFDDGHSSDYEIVFPVLQAAGIKAAFFVVVDRMGSPGHLSWEQVREMRRYGMEFGSHGMTHASMVKLAEKQALEELAVSRSRIEDQLGEEITAFSFPYGHYNADLIKLALATGYAACCISDHGAVSLPAHVIPRNSINGAMSWRGILKVLEPSPLVFFGWAAEDRVKKLAKRILNDESYRSLRSFVNKIRN